MDEVEAEKGQLNKNAMMKYGTLRNRSSWSIRGYLYVGIDISCFNHQTQPNIASWQRICYATTPLRFGGGGLPARIYSGTWCRCDATDSAFLFCCSWGFHLASRALCSDGRLVEHLIVSGTWRDVAPGLATTPMILHSRPVQIKTR